LAPHTSFAFRINLPRCRSRGNRHDDRGSAGSQDRTPDQNTASA